MTAPDKTLPILHPIEDDGWTCVCGNTPCASGFETTDASGNPMEPLLGSSWDGHYKCLECGQMHRAVGEMQ